MITGLFDRKFEYQVSAVACLFYERVVPYGYPWLTGTRLCVFWLTWRWSISQHNVLSALSDWAFSGWLFDNQNRTNLV